MNESNQTQAVARRQATPLEKIKGLIDTEAFKAQLKRACDKIPADQQVRAVLTVATKNPKLAECTPESFCGSLLALHQVGLQADGYLAHLVPYGTTCTPIIDYKGLVALVHRSGIADFIDADVVYENDEFNIQRGTDPKIEHKPTIRGTRGEIIGAYAVVHLKGSSKPQFAYMTKEDIDAVRATSRASGSGPWANQYAEMAKKTVLRRLSKLVPLRSEEREAVQTIEDHEFGEEERFKRAKPAQVVQAAVIAAPRPAAPATTSGNAVEDDVPWETATPAQGATQEAKTPPPAPATTQQPTKPAKAAPAPTTPPPAPAGGPSPSELLTETLNDLCDQANISKEAFVNFAVKHYRLSAGEDGIGSIKELVDLSPKKAAEIAKNFDAFTQQIPAA